MRTAIRRGAAVIAFTFVAMLCSQGSAQAQVLSGTFPIDGTQPVPPTGSVASGSGTVSVDLGTNILTWNITFAGLTGSETAAHFHGPAPAGANAGVQLGIGVGSPKIGSVAILPAQAADIAAGLWYVNIHSTTFPGGEIRGQVLVSAAPTVPTMGEWGLVALSILLLAAGAVVLRRRQAILA
ncbi:MAG: hypothetical protein ACI8QZ_002969 [Chlamydiales bacterium]|jgi:hypothetical protein